MNAAVLVDGVTLLSTLCPNGLSGVKVTTCSTTGTFYRLFVDDYASSEYDAHIISQMKTLGFTYVSADEWEDEGAISHFKIRATL